mgnify:CR=1 FL=1
MAWRGHRRCLCATQSQLVPAGHTHGCAFIELLIEMLAPATGQGRPHPTNRPRRAWASLRPRPPALVRATEPRSAHVSPARPAHKGRAHAPLFVSDLVEGSPRAMPRAASACATGSLTPSAAKVTWDNSLLLTSGVEIADSETPEENREAQSHGAATVPSVPKTVAEAAARPC